MTMDQNITASSWSTSLFFMGSYKCNWEIFCHQFCLKISTSDAKFCSEIQSETNLLVAQHILTALHKRQERFLVIVAMKWYHQTEKDQRTGPEKLTLHKMEPAANIISLAKIPCQAKLALPTATKQTWAWGLCHSLAQLLWHFKALTTYFTLISSLVKWR